MNIFRELMMMMQPMFATALMIALFVVLKHFTDDLFLITLAWLFSLICILLLFLLAVQKENLKNLAEKINEHSNCT